MAGCGDRTRLSLGNGSRFPHRGRGIFRLVVLAAATMAWFHRRDSRAARWRWLAAVPSVLGFAVALRCVWDFGWTGHGTPAPIAPPQRLVVVGFYRYVRNPMYVGFAAGWIGLWVIFGHADVAAIAAVAAAALGVDLFVIFYEEPNVEGKVWRAIRRISPQRTSLVAASARLEPTRIKRSQRRLKSVPVLADQELWTFLQSLFRGSIKPKCNWTRRQLA